MTISNFNQYALSRDEIKKIVGGFSDPSGKRCTGGCSIRREDGFVVPGECVVEKRKKIKVCTCNGTAIKSTCAFA